MEQKIALFLLNPLLTKTSKDSPSHGKFLEKLGFFWLPFEINIATWIKDAIKAIWTADETIWAEEKLLKSLKDKKNLRFQNIKDTLKKRKWNLHIIVSLVNISNIVPLLLERRWKGQIFLHLAIHSQNYKELLNDTKILQNLLKKYDNLTLASLAGSMSIFNQQEARRETQKVYDEIVFNQSQTSFSLDEYLFKQKENNIQPIDIAPVSFVEAEPLEDNDCMLILETDAENIELITKAFEVSKNQEKKSDFLNFNPAFITKNIPKLLLIVAKQPYPEYESEIIIKKEKYQTLSKVLSQKEIRQLHIWDKMHFKLITKYLNNEEEIIYDGQKNIKAIEITADNGDIIQTANENLFTQIENESKNFERFFLAGEYILEETRTITWRIQNAKKEKIWIIILNIPEKKIRFSEEIQNTKKKISLKELHKIIINEEK